MAPKAKKQGRKLAARKAKAPGKAGGGRVAARKGRVAARKGKVAARKGKVANPAQPPRVPLILLVEDFADAREMYAEYFRFVGHRVETAENGVEAISKALQLLPDVILMDLSLPVLDGWEATRRLKNDERTRAIPIVALTGNALQGHEERARKAGCDAFLAKPCLPEVVEQEVNKFLALRARVA